ncbi:MAG: NFACT RNA binding domain-containing protein [Candidatus Micrarchaeia archaeon]
MKIGIDFTKSARENAQAYFDQSKEARRKAQGAAAALGKTREQIGNLASKSEAGEKSAKPQVKVKRELKWFEKFHNFTTTGGLLVIAGRDASQNDLIYSKYLDDSDLFFHADIQGAPATVLKGGRDAPLPEKKEAAQFAASYSSAWKVGSPSVDVYCVLKSQLSKHAQGGFIPKGGFGISGQREWFRGTRLGLRIGMGEGGLAASVPEISKAQLKSACALVPGQKPKSDAVAVISKRTGAHPDEISLLVPSGKTTVRYV